MEDLTVKPVFYCDVKTIALGPGNPNVSRSNILRVSHVHFMLFVSSRWVANANAISVAIWA